MELGGRMDVEHKKSVWGVKTLGSQWGDIRRAQAMGPWGRDDQEHPAGQWYPTPTQHYGAPVAQLSLHPQHCCATFHFILKLLQAPSLVLSS